MKVIKYRKYTLALHDDPSHGIHWDIFAPPGRSRDLASTALTLAEAKKRVREFIKTQLTSI